MSALKRGFTLQNRSRPAGQSNSRRDRHITCARCCVSGPVLWWQRSMRRTANGSAVSPRPIETAWSLTVERRMRPAEAEADLWLVFAPIKRARLDWLIEKATELGVGALLPVWTQRTQTERLNLERLRAHAVAAAEQSERLSVPELHEPQALDRVLGRLVSGTSSCRLRRDRRRRTDRRGRCAARRRADGAADRPRRRFRRDGA